MTPARSCLPLKRLWRPRCGVILRVDHNVTLCFRQDAPLATPGTPLAELPARPRGSGERTPWQCRLGLLRWLVLEDDDAEVQGLAMCRPRRRPCGRSARHGTSVRGLARQMPLANTGLVIRAAASSCAAGMACEQMSRAFETVACPRRSETTSRHSPTFNGRVTCSGSLSRQCCNANRGTEWWCVFGGDVSRDGVRTLRQRASSNSWARRSGSARCR